MAVLPNISVIFRVELDFEYILVISPMTMRFNKVIETVKLGS